MPFREELERAASGLLVHANNTFNLKSLFFNGVNSDVRILSLDLNIEKAFSKGLDLRQEPS